MRWTGQDLTSLAATTRQSSLSKREVVLAIVRYLVSSGVTPEQVEEAVAAALATQFPALPFEIVPASPSAEIGP
jgi:hypothetical protein